MQNEIEESREMPRDFEEGEAFFVVATMLMTALVLGIVILTGMMILANYFGADGGKKLIEQGRALGPQEFIEGFNPNKHGTRVAVEIEEGADAFQMKNNTLYTNEVESEQEEVELKKKIDRALSGLERRPVGFASRGSDGSIPIEYLNPRELKEDLERLRAEVNSQE